MFIYFPCLFIFVLFFDFFFFSETGGLGVKMVEYVLGSSPTTPKDLEPRMVSLRLVSLTNDDKVFLVYFKIKKKIHIYL